VPTPVDVTTTTAEVAIATPAVAVAIPNQELAYTGINTGIELAIAGGAIALGALMRRIAHING
jgi:hypothetical protein